MSQENWIENEIQDKKAAIHDLKERIERQKEINEKLKQVVEADG
jgi:hypothetical protein